MLAALVKPHRVETSTPRNDAVRCLRPCKPPPFRHCQAFQACGNGKWSGRSSARILRPTMDQVNESAGDRALLCGWSAIRRQKRASGLVSSVPECVVGPKLNVLPPASLRPVRFQSPLLQSGPEGEFMGHLSGVVQQLKKERERAQKALIRIDAAIAALGSSGSNGHQSISAAGRRAISLAQKARWAKQKSSGLAGKTKP